jgi:thiamine-monophosphate kinase
LKLKELGEFTLIERIRHQVAAGPGVIRGIGDDAAVLDLPAGEQLLTSTDMLVEGVHFRRDWGDARSLGRKAVAVNLSDIAAMGGVPRFLYLGLACAGETEADDVLAFLDGALEEAARSEVTLVGGDTCRSPGPWLISVTVEGSVAEGRAIGRDGARVGDLLMVSGTLGDSAMALSLLQRGETPEPFLLERHLLPTARLALGRRLGLGGLATAMIDLSDGLLGDLDHILQGSAVEAVIEEAALPLSEPLLRCSSGRSAAVEMALSGGEDYELLFCVQPEHGAAVNALAAELALPVATIGRIRAGRGGVSLRSFDGTERTVSVNGYDHFCCQVEGAQAT